MSAAHKITARGYRPGSRGYPALLQGVGFNRKSIKRTVNARVHFAVGGGCQQAEAAKLDAASAANPKEPGYGG